MKKEPLHGGPFLRGSRLLPIGQKSRSVVVGIVVMVMMMEPMGDAGTRNIAYRASADGPDRSADNGASAGAHQSIVKSLPRHCGGSGKRDTNDQRCNIKDVCHFHIPLVRRTINIFGQTIGVRISIAATAFRFEKS